MVSHLHHRESSGTSTPQTRGFVWNWARRYDLLIGFVTLGREQAFRQRIADLAKLEPGESVAGCGDVSELRTRESTKRVRHFSPASSGCQATSTMALKASNWWRNTSRWWARETCCFIVVRTRKNWRTSSKALQKRDAEATLPNPRIG